MCSNISISINLQTHIDVQLYPAKGVTVERLNVHHWVHLYLSFPHVLLETKSFWSAILKAVSFCSEGRAGVSREPWSEDIRKQPSRKTRQHRDILKTFVTFDNGGGPFT